jgi:hypothetical protein
LRQQVLLAAREANAEKALGLLAARYQITDQAIKENPFSQEVEKYLKSGMAQVEEMKELRLSGSRTVSTELTTTARVKPNFLGLLTSGGGGALNAGMLWFNVISLKMAYNSLQKSSAPEYTMGFAASIFGVIGAAAATLVSVRATQKAVMLRLSVMAPGMAFGNGLVKFLGSNLFARLSGYPAIFLGLLSDLEKSKRQKAYGDTDASDLTFYGGGAVAIGSALVLEGGLAIAGATTFIPFAGWAAAAVVLLGAAVIAGGLYLHAKSSERLHNPVELWATRSVFGTRLNDGEKRPDLILDFDKKLPPFASIKDEINSWYAAYYLPSLLSNKETNQFELGHLDSKWTEPNTWVTRSWTTSTDKDALNNVPVAEFTILLRGFHLGQSKWQASLSSLADNKEIALPTTPNCYMIRGGLLLNFKNEIPNHHNVKLEIRYQPNLGIEEQALSSQTFTLEK